MMTLDDTIKFVLDQVTASGATGDAILSQNSTLSLKVEDGALSEYKVASGQTISLRVVKDNRVGTSYSEAFDSEQLAAMVKDALMNAQFTKEDPHEQIRVRDIRISPSAESITTETEIPVENKVEMAVRLEQALREKPIPASAPYNGLSESTRTVRVANTLGTDCSHHESHYTCFTSALIDQEGQQAMHYSLRSAESFAGLDVDGCLDEAYSTALDLLNSEGLKTGRYDVIFSPDCLSSLLGAFGIFVDGESAMKGLNPLRERIGHQVASKALTLVNTPQLPGGSHSRPFDDEGFHTNETTIIDGGTLKTFLHNTKTSSFFAVPNTGNARRGGSGLKVAPQHLHILPDTSNTTMVEDGQYLELVSVDGMHSGANAISGDFSVGASGYVCENGVRKRAFRGVTVAHNFYEMLLNIRAIGSEAQWNSQRTLLTPLVRFEGCSIAGE